MTVEELIEVLQTVDPKKQVVLYFIRYTKHRHVSRATRPVSYPIDKVTANNWDRKVYLVADQEGDYG